MAQERFSEDRAALDFVASQIEQEAERERIPFSDLERKMLYFSESAWTLPDIMEVNDEFVKEYNDTIYEKKVAGLIKRAYGRARKENAEEYRCWLDAIEQLSKNDRYLLIMVSQAGVHVKVPLPARPPGDMLRLWLTGIATVTFVSVIGAFVIRHSPSSASSRDNTAVAIWAAAASAAALYTIVRWLFGGAKVDRTFWTWIFGRAKRGE